MRLELVAGLLLGLLLQKLKERGEVAALLIDILQALARGLVMWVELEDARQKGQRLSDVVELLLPQIGDVGQKLDGPAQVPALGGRLGLLREQVPQLAEAAVRLEQLLELLEGLSVLRVQLEQLTQRVDPVDVPARDLIPVDLGDLFEQSDPIRDRRLVALLGQRLVLGAQVVIERVPLLVLLIQPAQLGARVQILGVLLQEGPPGVDGLLR